MLPRLRQDKSRRAILEGIYRENRRIFHNEPLIPYRRRYGRVFFQFAIVLLVFPGVFVGGLASIDSDHPVYKSLRTYFPEARELRQLTGLLPVAAAPERRQPVLRQEVAKVQKSVERTEIEDPRWKEKVLPPLGTATTPGVWFGEKDLEWARQHNDFFKMDPVAVSDVFGLEVKTIVIDAGHGGRDPGTSGKSGLQEKLITLDVALRLKKRLEENFNYRVYLTRDEDKYVSLKDRIFFANQMKADLFISVHVNYWPSKPNNMIETYFYGMTEDDDALEAAKHANHQSDFSINEFTALAEQLGDTLKLQESRRLADEVQKSLYHNISKGDASVLNMGVKQAPFLVLMGTRMPSILAEVTCLSNAEEERKLYNPAYRDDIASFMESGIIGYLNKEEQVYASR
jgi:N-acetylmuramoyl-L-alanine amidase